MQAILKSKGKSGFTLIELMVVVVLVIVLSLALVPTFRELITKAKYTEGAAAISAINTKIKVYQVEKTVLPGAITNEKTYGTSGRVGGFANRTIRLVNITNQWFRYENGTGAADDATLGISPIQQALEIGPEEYSGRYFSQTDYQIRIDNAGRQTDGYQYTVAACGNGGVGKAPVGTAYGVLTCNNTRMLETEPEKLLVATFARYKPLNNATNQMFLNGDIVDNLDGIMINVPDIYAYPNDTTVNTKEKCKVILEASGWSLD